MIEKSHILDEIRRTAQENGGTPLGMKRFFAETGIRQEDWYGRYWVRWNQALVEAGFGPNRLQAAFGKQLLLARLAELTRELGHLPLKAELMLKRRRDPSFPSHSTFHRLGGKKMLVALLQAYCQQNAGLGDVLGICDSVAVSERADRTSSRVSIQEEFGHVYLLRSGRFYKIGRSNAVGRRERELGLQLPEKAAVVHQIRTDDPPGIEAYWHGRFAAKRKRGEWFDLTADDVAAFKRRKFM